MKKKNVFDYFEDIESKDEILKKWSDLLTIEESIIAKIVQSRKDLGLSQKELAKMTNLKQPAISRIESGAHSPQLDTLIKVADALDLKIEIKRSSEYIDRLCDRTYDFVIESFQESFLSVQRYNINTSYYEKGGLPYGNKTYKLPRCTNFIAW